MTKVKKDVFLTEKEAGDAFDIFLKTELVEFLQPEDEDQAKEFESLIVIFKQCFYSGSISGFSLAAQKMKKIIEGE